MIRGYASVFPEAEPQEESIRELIGKPEAYRHGVWQSHSDQ
jgi:hypothetical protein